LLFPHYIICTASFLKSIRFRNLPCLLLCLLGRVTLIHVSSTASLRVLCFGDSLTAGYTNWGMRHFPYAAHLTDHLQAAFPSTLIHVDVEGMSGAQVRGQYTGRLNRACTKAKDAPYDWIVIMGGTNDLGWGGQPQEIYEALRGWLPLPSSLSPFLPKIQGSRSSIFNTGFPRSRFLYFHVYL